MRIYYVEYKRYNEYFDEYMKKKVFFQTRELAEKWIEKSEALGVEVIRRDDNNEAIWTEWLHTMV